MPTDPLRRGRVARTVTACPALQADNNADWSVGTAGVYATGTCNSGWYGTPQRLCNLNGWGAVTSPCQRTSY